MKIFYLSIIMLLPLVADCQTILASSDEPMVLYQDINNSLSCSRPKQALHSFRKVVDFYSSRDKKNELPEKYFGMALALALSGYYKESIRYHKKAIRLHRRYRTDEPLEISINLGLTYYLAGKDRKARRILGDSI
jgi:tetratricopeptide (TPR) repeat protein